MISYILVKVFCHQMLMKVIFQLSSSFIKFLNINPLKVLPISTIIFEICFKNNEVKSSYKVFHKLTSMNFLVLKILWTNNVTTLPSIYLNYFVSKTVLLITLYLRILLRIFERSMYWLFTLVENNLRESYALTVYFGRSVDKISRKMLSLEFDGRH